MKKNDPINSDIENYNNESENGLYFEDSTEILEDYDNSISKKSEEEIIKKLQEKVDNNYDLYLRSQAELENTKKRFLRDKEDLIKFANEKLIKELLTVLDNLDMAIECSLTADCPESFKEGVQLIKKNLESILGKTGLEVIESNGKIFDPNFHEAIAEIQNDQEPIGTICEEYQKGYSLNGRILRASKVIVSKK